MNYKFQLPNPVSQNKGRNMSEQKLPTTSAERMRLKRKRDREDPDRKFRKLDSIYMFDEIDIAVIVDDDGNIWFKAVDLARALEMEDPNHSVFHSIDKKYCKSYETLSSSSDRYSHIPNMHPKTIFVNETGMNMFIMRSRKPKAEGFAEWMGGVVLPSIRRTNEYEIDTGENPYRELNEFWTRQMEELRREKEELKSQNNELKNEKEELKREKDELKNEKNELKSQNNDLKREKDDLKNEKDELKSQNNVLKNEKDKLENENNALKSEKDEMKSDNKELKTQTNEFQKDLRKSIAHSETQQKELVNCVKQLFKMKASCVPKLQNEAKREYFIVYRKYKPDRFESMPYYACRIQLDSLEQRRNELLEKYPDLETLLKLTVPNSVAFFNFVLEQMPDFLVRGTGRDKQSFGLKSIGEREMLTMIENLYRTHHGIAPGDKP